MVTEGSKTLSRYPASVIINNYNFYKFHLPRAAPSDDECPHDSVFLLRITALPVLHDTYRASIGSDLVSFVL